MHGAGKKRFWKRQLRRAIQQLNKTDIFENQYNGYKKRCDAFIKSRGKRIKNQKWWTKNCTCDVHKLTMLTQDTSFNVYRLVIVRLVWIFTLNGVHFYTLFFRSFHYWWNFSQNWFFLFLSDFADFNQTVTFFPHFSALFD